MHFGKAAHKKGHGRTHDLVHVLVTCTCLRSNGNGHNVVIGCHI